jgi:nucleoside-diphosphate-sugar epimerase
MDNHAATVLVTGAAGFVGLNIVRRLAAQGWPVVALARREPDADTRRFLEPVAGLVRFAQGDVRDRAGLAAMVRREGVRRIVHGAAITSAEAERDDPAGFVDVNLGGTLNVLEAARQADVERVVLISSSGVYGAPAERARLIDEEDPLQISNSYTICKQAGELLCRRYGELYGLSAVAGRLGTAYGPMERPTGSRSAMSQVYTLLHAALDGRPLAIYGAERLRDVCYIDDVADAFCALTLAKRLDHTIYNVSAGTAHSLSEIAAAVAALVPGAAWAPAETPEDADLIVRPPSERGPMSLGRLRADTRFAPRFTLQEGLAHYLAWLRAQ